MYTEPKFVLDPVRDAEKIEEVGKQKEDEILEV